MDFNLYLANHFIFGSLGSDSSTWIIVAVVLLSICYFFFYHVFNDRIAEQRKTEASELARKSREECLNHISEAIHQVINECLQEHGEILLRKRRNLQHRDEYGVIIDSGWWKELTHYHNHVAKPRLRNEIDRLDLCAWYTATHEIDIEKTFTTRLVKSLDELQAKAGITLLSDVPTNPYEYEGFCRHLLEQTGWMATQTPATGDQGADVIAKKGMCVMVLQCKLWNSPVGNKAVQEIAAAKIFYGANAAAVVSNQVYTESAKALAEKTAVLLLHHNDLTCLQVETDSSCS